ncbi:6146_t:CDS:2, partial [Acaulospora morrowiae]
MSKYSASSNISRNHNASIVNSPSPTNEITEPVSDSEDPPTSPLSQNIPSPTFPVSARNSKQNFFSLFKKKDGNTINSGPANRYSAPPQQRVVLDHNNNMNTAEEATHNIHHHFEALHHVPQSIIGNASREQENGSAYTISGGKPSTNSPKKNSIRKGSIVSQKEDLGFKVQDIQNTMKNTMRKTSTFFKKFGNKQNSENNFTNDGRLPIPDFHDDDSNLRNPTSNDLQHLSSNTLNSDVLSDEFSLSEQLVSASSDVSLSDKNFTVDEQDVLQRTLQDYASVYANLNESECDYGNSEFHKDSVQSTSKAVTDDIGASHNRSSQSRGVKSEQSLLINSHEGNGYNKRTGDKNFMSLPVIRSEKRSVESKMAWGELSTASLPRVKEEDDNENNQASIKSTTNKNGIKSPS